jgi:hypothetical protein
LEFIQIDVQGTSKAKRNRYRRDNLGDQSIQIVEARLGNPKVFFANPEYRLVVNLKRKAHHRGLTEQQSSYHEGAVGML